MRKITVGIAATVALIATRALAADLAVKAPPMVPPPVFTWTGFYIGVEGGYGWGNADQTDATGFDSGRYNVSGGLVGGTLGYNWQINQFVLGLEGDGSGAWIRGSTAGAFGGCGGAPPQCFSELQALGTFRGRVGVAFGNILPFATGGLAVGSIHGSEGTTLAAGAVGSGSATVAGWTVGGGLEAKLPQNWSIKAQYLYVDLGNQTIFNDTIPFPPPPAVVGQRIRFTTNIVQAGLNYKFDLGSLAMVMH